MYTWASCLSMIKHRNLGTRQGNDVLIRSEIALWAVLHSLATEVEIQQEQGASWDSRFTGQGPCTSWGGERQEQRKVGCSGHIPHRQYIISQGRWQIKLVVCVLVSKDRERYAKEFIFLLIGNSTSDLQGVVSSGQHMEKHPTTQAWESHCP